MQEIRKQIQQKVKDAHLRCHLLKELVSDEWIDHCRTHPDKVKEWMLEWVDQYISVGM
jgi:precorrin-2 dehydrogenase/sirohydrochlorin ferrochelatase